MSSPGTGDWVHHRLRVRYLEADAQGVVFNMWYLAYFDDAMTAFLADRGLPYDEMLAEGTDVQLVHTELDWTGGARLLEEIDVLVRCSKLGTTSFTLDFAVERPGGERICTGQTVYVAIHTDGSGKRPLTDRLRAALGDSRPKPGGQVASVG